MGKVQETRRYHDISADQAYKLAESALEETGFQIWKRRPLGWLLMADYENEDGKISGNVSCRPGAGTSITITLDSSEHRESYITSLVEDFYLAIDPDKSS